MVSWSQFDRIFIEILCFNEFSGRGSDRADKSQRNVRDVMRPRNTGGASVGGGGGGGSDAVGGGSSSSSATPTSSSSSSSRAALLSSHSKSASKLMAGAGAPSYTPVYDHHQRGGGVGGVGGVGGGVGGGGASSSAPSVGGGGGGGGDVYRKLQAAASVGEDAVYAVPKATPTVILGEEYQEVPGSHFQRQDWFRRKSHSKKQLATASAVSGVGSGKFRDSPPLRRSASDESLANTPSSSMVSASIGGHHGHGDLHNSKKPASHRKGRAPAPPSASAAAAAAAAAAQADARRLDAMELSRSKSDANLDLPDGGHSRSASHGHAGVAKSANDAAEYRTQ